MPRPGDTPPEVVDEQAALRVTGWDAIRVPRHAGLTMLHRLSRVSPPVVVDPVERSLYFLVPIGSADHWQLSERQIVDIRHQLTLPPTRQQAPPGRYWLLLPTFSAQRAALRSLRAALEGLWCCLGDLEEAAGVRQCCEGRSS